MKSTKWVKSGKSRFGAGLSAIGLLGMLCIAIAPSKANAAVLVVGGSASATVEGNTANLAPFGLPNGSTATYEQVYNQSAFSSISSPVVISQIAFRPDATYGSAFSYDLTAMQLSLSTSTKSADNLSSTFANNLGSDNTTVLSGPYHLSSAFTAAAGGTKAFDIILNLSTPFVYDPSKGSLLMALSLTGINNPAYPGTYFDAQSATGDNISRAYATPWSSINMSLDTVGLVTQFTYSPVPEPGTAFAGAMALAGISGATWRRRFARK